MRELVPTHDKAYHIVNSQVVMVLENGKSYDNQNMTSLLSRGKIPLQAEGAEILYKNINIIKVNKLPEAFASQI